MKLQRSPSFSLKNSKSGNLAELTKNSSVKRMGHLTEEENLSFHGPKTCWSHGPSGYYTR